ncbi:MAG TPA: hypothetical protein VMS76_05545 [Planctomycetota bacterium]|nr:hypothetical protein [Planctomycetota bacterium]
MMKTFLTFAFGAPLLTLALLAQDGAAPKPAEGAKPGADQAVVDAQRPSYPLATCVVSGEPLGGEHGEPVEYVKDGRLLRLCCKMCAKDVDKSPAEFIAKVDAAVIAAQKPTYPLEQCPVSGEKLGSMGEPLDHVYGTRLVRFCCKGCIKGLNKDPKKVLAQIDEALIAQQKASYPLSTCVISGEDLDAEGGAPVDFLYGVRLVRFCCKQCIGEFKKDPDAHLSKLDAARAKGPAR